VSGRADSTLSHMGANLYPEDVDAALGVLADRRPELALGAFCLSLGEVADGTTRPVVHVEVGSPQARIDPHVAESIRAAVTGWLVDHNRDWMAAAAEDPRALDFAVEATRPGTGVFEANAVRIKRRYLLPTGGDRS
jgi:phenylacetate-CoA ligase